MFSVVLTRDIHCTCMNDSLRCIFLLMLIRAGMSVSNIIMI